MWHYVPLYGMWMCHAPPASALLRPCGPLEHGARLRFLCTPGGVIEGAKKEWIDHQPIAGEIPKVQLQREERGLDERRDVLRKETLRLVASPVVSHARVVDPGRHLTGPVRFGRGLAR